MRQETLSFLQTKRYEFGAAQSDSLSIHPTRA